MPQKSRRRNFSWVPGEILVVRRQALGRLPLLHVGPGFCLVEWGVRAVPCGPFRGNQDADGHGHAPENRFGPFP